MQKISYLCRAFNILEIDSAWAGKTECKSVLIKITIIMKTKFTFVAHYVPIFVCMLCMSLLSVPLHASSHTLSWDPNGGTLIDGEYTHGEVEAGTPIIAPNAERDGYTFRSWGNVPAFMPDEDLALVAQWISDAEAVIIKFQLVKKNLGSGYSEPFKTHTVVAKINESVECPPLEDVEGFETPDGDFFISFATPGEHTFLLKYERNSYDLEWDVNGGNELTGSYTEGDTKYEANIKKPNDPTRAGYDFLNWEPVAPATMPAHDVTCVAQWQARTDTKYTVEHWQQTLEGGDNYVRVETEEFEGETATEVTPDVKAYEGFTAPAPTTAVILGDGSLVVVYKYSRNQHNLSWDANEGVLSGEYTEGLLFFGATIVKPTAERVGYTFNGWNSEVPATMPDADQSFTAQWKANTDTKYVVEHWQQTLEGGDNYVRVETEEKEGETATEVTPDVKAYLGFTAPAPTTAVILADGSLVIEYKYTRNQHDLSWDANEGVLSGEYTEGTLFFGAAIVEPTAEREGYAFTGWDSEVPATMPDADQSFIAQWQVKEYTLTYLLNGAVYGEIEYIAFGTPLTLRPNPEIPEGFVFSGWSELPATMPAEEVTVEGFFIPTYTLTFILGTETYSYPGVPEGTNLQGIIDALIGIYGNTYETPEYIYTLSGWEEEPLPEKVTEDLTLTATYTMEPQKYKLTYWLNGEIDGDVEIIAYGTELTLRDAPIAPEGYEFSGWSELPATMPAANVDITGSFIAKKYELKYLLDGELYGAVENIAFGSELTLRPNPADREGFVFSGWEGLPATMPAHEVIVTGSFIPTFTVKLVEIPWSWLGSIILHAEDKDGQSLVGEGLEMVRNEEDIYVATIANGNADPAIKISFSCGEGQSMVLEDIDLSLTNKFKIYNDQEDDGTYYTGVMYFSYFYDEDQTTLLWTSLRETDEVPIYEGITPYKDASHIFNGWDREFERVDGAKYYATYKEQETPAELLPGKFSVSATKKVQFARGNLIYNQATEAWSIARTQDYVIGHSNINLGDDHFKGEIDMFGWSTTSTYYGVSGSNKDADYTGDFVDWANLIGEHWYTMPQSEWNYLMKTRANAGNLWGNGQVAGRKGIIFLPDNWELPEGMEFKAKYKPTWYFTYRNFEHNVYTAEEWQVMEAAGAVFLPAAGRRTGGYGNIWAGAEVAPFVNPETGWYSSMDNIDEYGYYWTTTQDSREDYSHCATYLIFGGVDNAYTYEEPRLWSCEKRRGQAVRLVQEVLYKVEWKNEDGTLLETDNEPYGADPEYNGETPTKEPTAEYRYEFAGWTPELQPVTADVIYTATFTEIPQEYNLTYKLDGELYAEATVAYGTELTVLPDPAPREGYEFSGWRELPETMPANDVEIIGSFIAKKYTLTYKLDGELYSEETVAYGTELTVLPDPDPREGFVFSGWEGLPATMPAHEVIVTGSFIPTFTLTVVEIPWTWNKSITLHAEDIDGHSLVGEGLAMVRNEEGFYVATIANGNADPTLKISFSSGEKQSIDIEGVDETSTYKFKVLDEGWMEDGKYYTGEVYYNYFYDEDRTTLLWTSIRMTDEVPVYGGTTPYKDASHIFNGWDKQFVKVDGTSYYATYKELAAPSELLTGQFSVGGGVKVQFARGNLIHNLGSNTWSIARTQDFNIGYNNINLGNENFKGDIDLFGWSSESTYYGVNASNADADYTGEFVDWGTLIGEQWFTMTYEQWNHLFNIRDNHANLWANGQVAGRNGLILLPDDWQLPEGMNFVPQYKTANDLEYDFLESNVYTAEEWQVMEAAGAVFLPSAGRRTGGYGNKMNGAAEATFFNPEGWYAWVDNITVYGYYWTSTPDTREGKQHQANYLIYGGEKNAWPLQQPILGPCEKRRGQAVRLVQEVLYKVEWKNEDGTLLETDNEPYGADPEYNGETPTKEPTAEYRYEFAGWTPELQPVTADVIYTATFTEIPQEYNLTYKLDGELYSEAIVAYGTELTVLPDPEPREGYEFSGWSELPETMPANDLEIIGSFIAKEYTLTYKLNGELYSEATVAYGTELTVLPDPEEREGYEFSGWSELPETMPAKDVEVIGSFIPKEYKLTYKVDGKQYGEIETIAFGAPVTPRETPEKEGHIFVGWTGLPETMPAKDVIVYGYFVPLYTVTFTLGQGKKPERVVPNGTELQPIIDEILDVYGQTYETAEGLYVFTGWENEPLPTLVTENMTLTAVYVLNPKEYTLTYILNDEFYASQTIDYGTTIEPLADPVAPEGFAFSGWIGLPETMPAKDVTVTGKIVAKDICTIQLVVDEDFVESFEIYKGEPLKSVVEQWLEEHDNKYSNGCKEYTITGWVEGELPETAVENAIYHAIFKEAWILYTITFEDYDGTVLYTQQLHCGQWPEYDGETPYRPEETIKIGEDGSWKNVQYDFLGWSPEFEEVTGDATYTATYDEREVATEVEKAENNKTYRKVFENGVLYIIQEGRKYDATGKRVE